MFGYLKNHLRGLEIYCTLILSAVLAFVSHFPGGLGKRESPKSTSDSTVAIFYCLLSLSKHAYSGNKRQHFQSGDADSWLRISWHNIVWPKEANEGIDGGHLVHSEKRSQRWMAWFSALCSAPASLWVLLHRLFFVWFIFSFYAQNLYYYFFEEKTWYVWHGCWGHWL